MVSVEDPVVVQSYERIRVAVYCELGKNLPNERHELRDVAVVTWEQQALVVSGVEVQWFDGWRFTPATARRFSSDVLGAMQTPGNWTAFIRSITTTLIGEAIKASMERRRKA